ncbi:MAG: DUF3179 domain-containing protein [Actinomycetota bacterium]
MAGLAVLIAACSSGGAVDGAERERAAVTAPSTTIEDYPDAQTRALRRLATAPRPVANSAIPPRHLDQERFPEALVDRYLIVSGGVQPDAIPPIDEPRFENVADVDWLTDGEAVLALEVEGAARAYPVQVMIWHEIVNDTVGGVPVTVSYCPLCNSATAFERRVADGTVLDFGVSGGLYQSALVMYDRQSESLWTHFDGRAVIGDRIGEALTLVPVATVSWADFAAAHPDGRVLARVDPSRPYGRNPYGSHDSRTDPLPGFFRGEVDPRLAPMERVVGVQIEGAEVAIPLTRLQAERLVIVDIGDRRAAVAWVPGAVSALDTDRVDEGAEIGSTGVFWIEGDVVSGADGEALAIPATGARWDILGRALHDSSAAALEPVPHVDTFWFAWSSYHPATDVSS